MRERWPKDHPLPSHDHHRDDHHLLFLPALDKDSSREDGSWLVRRWPVCSWIGSPFSSTRLSSFSIAPRLL